MKNLSKRKQDVIIFCSIFIVVFFALATSLHYSPLEVAGMPYALRAIINVIVFPAVAISLFPSFFLTTAFLCNSSYSCPGLLDAYSFENAVIMILVSLFSAMLYGFIALLISGLIRYIKRKI